MDDRKGVWELTGQLLHTVSDFNECTSSVLRTPIVSTGIKHLGGELFSVIMIIITDFWTVYQVLLGH